MEIAAWPASNFIIFTRSSLKALCVKVFSKYTAAFHCSCIGSGTHITESGFFLIIYGSEENGFIFEALSITIASLVRNAVLIREAGNIFSLSLLFNLSF